MTICRLSKSLSNTINVYKIIQPCQTPWQVCTSLSNTMKHHDKVVQACQTSRTTTTRLYKLVKHRKPPQQGCTSLSNTTTRLYKLVKHRNKLVQACQTPRQGCTTVSTSLSQPSTTSNKLVQAGDKLVARWWQGCHFYMGRCTQCWTYVDDRI